MKKITAMLLGAAILVAAAAAGAYADQIKIGVGVIGPISPQTEADIDQIVGKLPNVKAVPIQPPGGVDACVKRYVAGDPDDRLDAVMVVSLPTESFQSSRDSNEAKFTGAYEIWTLNLSTLAEDRHRFTFTDSEPVIGGVAAFLALPAQAFAERATGKKLISSDQWQAFEAVQTRVEAKLVAATKLYLATASIRDTTPLVPLDTAKALLDRGDGEDAMLVFKSAGINNPDVQRMIAAAQGQLRRSAANALIGRTLGAMAGGNAGAARVILADYEKAPSAETFARGFDSPRAGGHADPSRFSLRRRPQERRAHARPSGVRRDDQAALQRADRLLAQRRNRQRQGPDDRGQGRAQGAEGTARHLRGRARAQRVADEPQVRMRRERGAERRRRSATRC